MQLLQHDTLQFFNDYNLLIIYKNHLCKYFNFINFIDFVTLAYIRKDSLNLM